MNTGMCTSSIQENVIRQKLSNQKNTYKSVEFIFFQRACKHIINVLQINKFLTSSAERTYVKKSCCSTAHFHRYLQAASVSHLQPIGFCFFKKKRKKTHAVNLYTCIFSPKTLGVLGICKSLWYQEYQNVFSLSSCCYMYVH